MATSKTVRDLIESVLRVVGNLASEETPTAADTQIVLEAFQDYIAENAGDLFVPITTQEAITLVNAQNSYTLGENGSPDLNTQRPEQIIGAWIRDSNNLDYPIRLIGEREYRSIASKTTAARPEMIWYNPTAPNGTIYTYPTPTTAESLYISSIKQLTEPTSLSDDILDDIGIPRNYHRPLKWILAEEVGEEFGASISKTITKNATMAKAKLISLNAARKVQPAMFELAAGKSRIGNSILSY